MKWRLDNDWERGATRADDELRKGRYEDNFDDFLASLDDMRDPHDEITIQPRINDTRSLHNLRLIQFIGLVWLLVGVYAGLLVRAGAVLMALFRRKGRKND